ncbi:MAG TPA: GNAT family N-acetyltransferase [bacterium]|nr:GNAT family N-acetyltransferase [bacterium]
MSSETRIRPGTTQDLDAIGELWKEFMDFHSQRDPHFTRSADGDEAFREYLAGHISSGGSCVLVAERAGEVIGYCLAVVAKSPPVVAERDHGTILDLAVTARYRRQGIGRRLYETALAWLVEHGMHRVELRAVVSNEVSTAFWKKLGFKAYIETLFRDV